MVWMCLFFGVHLWPKLPLSHLGSSPGSYLWQSAEGYLWPASPSLRRWSINSLMLVTGSLFLLKIHVLILLTLLPISSSSVDSHTAPRRNRTHLLDTGHKPHQIYAMLQEENTHHTHLLDLLTPQLTRTPEIQVSLSLMLSACHSNLCLPLQAYDSTCKSKSLKTISNSCYLWTSRCNH